ncbi:MAG: DUF1080 domain-containing protein [Planctomycetota bacterium]
MPSAATQTLAATLKTAARTAALLAATLIAAGAGRADHHAEEPNTTQPGAEPPLAATSKNAEPDADGWVELFNGKDLDGWRVSENPDTFRVAGGVMIAKGPRAHAFYVGKVGGADFKDFELKFEAMTKPNANSGVFFHTAYQETGWPAQGYEVQVNQTQGDRIKSGSIYGVKNLLDTSPVKDNAWYTTHVIVRGKRIVVKINGEVVNEYTEPDDLTPPADREGRRLSRGTIAIQGHDPGSEVHFRSIKVRMIEE